MISMSSKDSPDFITKYPDAIKVITDEKLYFSLLDNPNIEPIIVILREGPLTLEEIVEGYNQYVAMKGKEKKLTKTEIEEAQKSETSVYRYIKNRRRKVDFATFEDGHIANAIVDAVLKSSENKKWINVKY